MHEAVGPCVNKLFRVRVLSVLQWCALKYGRSFIQDDSYGRSRSKEKETSSMVLVQGCTYVACACTCT